MEYSDPVTVGFAQSKRLADVEKFAWPAKIHTDQTYCRGLPRTEQSCLGG
jgi:hypothetical protein